MSCRYLYSCLTNHSQRDGNPDAGVREGGGCKPFIFVENGHAENCNYPAYDADNDDSHNDGHLAIADSGQDLTTNDAINRGVANHENDVEQAQDFGRPVAHEEPQNNLFWWNFRVSKNEFFFPLALSLSLSFYFPTVICAQISHDAGAFWVWLFGRQDRVRASDSEAFVWASKTHHCSVSTLRTPYTHVSRGQTADERAENCTDGTIQEAQFICQGTQHGCSQIVQRDVGAVPHDGNLDIARGGRRLSLFWENTGDAASLEPSQIFDATVDSPPCRRHRKLVGNAMLGSTSEFLISRSSRAQLRDAFLVERLGLIMPTVGRGGRFHCFAGYVARSRGM